MSVMHWAQVVAVLSSGAALISVLVEGIPLWGERGIFALAVLTTVYAIKQALNAVTAMNDLVWQAAAYERLRKRAEAGNPLRPRMKLAPFRPHMTQRKLAQMRPQGSATFHRIAQGFSATARAWPQR